MPVAKLKCKECGDFEYRDKIVKTPYGKFCSVDHAYLFAQDKLNKAKERKLAKARQSQVKKDKVRIKELMSRSQWYKKLQSLVNQWILHVRDFGKPCYTCGTTKQNIKYDAGHRHHAGRGGGDRRRFILENIHKQCSVQCNQYGSGKPKEYDLSLDEEYGEGFSKKLSCISNYPELKEQFPTWQDIENEIIRYRKLLRENGLTPNS